MSNIYRELVNLLPATPLQIAQVVAVNTDNTSTVQFADGSLQRVRGTIVAVGQPAFVRAGIVEGVAPSRSVIVVEV